MKMIALIALFCLFCTYTEAREYKHVRGVIFIGDSIFDVGTNKYLQNSISRCDRAPYGETHLGPTGRCSNGYLIPDFIAKELGLPLSRPYLEVRNDDRLPNSLNTASDGSGFLNGTHAEWGVVPFDEQLEQLREISKRVSSKHLKDWIIVMSAGGNDIFVMQPNGTAIEQGVEDMESNFRRGMREIYDMGFRKVMVSSVGVLGCSPVLTTAAAPFLHGGCIEPLNAVARDLNSRMERFVKNSDRELPGIKMTFADGYARMEEMLADTNEMNVTSGCCTNCLGPPSNTSYQVCSDPSKYMFWDTVHPTERAYEIFSEAFISGNETYVRPYNVRELAEHHHHRRFHIFKLSTWLSVFLVIVAVAALCIVCGLGVICFRRTI